MVHSFEKGCKELITPAGALVIPIRVQKRNFELRFLVWSIKRDKLFRIHSDFENYTLERKLVLVFLPAYSPDLSPIELCWSKFKEFLRSREARTQEELDLAITEAIAQITEDDTFGWFAHCGLFI